MTEVEELRQMLIESKKENTVLKQEIEILKKALSEEVAEKNQGYQKMSRYNSQPWISRYSSAGRATDL